MSCLTRYFPSAVRLPHAETIPIFLAPALARPCLTIQTSAFSTSQPHPVRMRQRRHNPDRGVSALRRSGLGRPLSVNEVVRKEGLPRPVLDPKRRSKVSVDPEHALYGFFNGEKALLTKMTDEAAHGMSASCLEKRSDQYNGFMEGYEARTQASEANGKTGRPWEGPELRQKSWEEIHSLWYVCCKERNRLATEKKEMERMKLKDEKKAIARRDYAVRKTQAAIKWALTERWYAWEDAWKMAEKDPSINLEKGNLEDPIYTPPQDVIEDEGAMRDPAEEERPLKATSA